LVAEFILEGVKARLELNWLHFGIFRAGDAERPREGEARVVLGTAVETLVSAKSLRAKDVLDDVVLFHLRDLLVVPQDILLDFMAKARLCL